MRQYISELLPLIVEALLDGAVVTKYEVVVSTIGQVLQSTGYVITPYNEYPQLLGFLLKLLNGELAWSTRREGLKVLGIMGALDRHLHKHNQQSLPGSHGEVTRVTGDSGQHIRSMDELPMDLWPSFAIFEDYYSTHIRKYMPELLSRILELWSLFSLHVANRPVHIAPVGTLDEVRRGAVKNLTRLIPCVQVTRHISLLVHHLKLVLDGFDSYFHININDNV
ncbi:hypothetical protein KY285_023725 [Solanum tuberosum]|nr:hypothetical protein KY289_024055 [Solanum tuberosum]KAH0675924.1 hypothetical protein KY285_023725 [Solanum tuberosum]